MAFDFPGLAETAQTLVADAGRDVTLIALDFDAQDAAKPWRGPRDPRETPARTLTLKAAFVPLSSLSTMGTRKVAADILKATDKTCLIGSTADLGGFHELLDSRDGKRYKILLVDELEPGDLRIMSYMLLKEHRV